MVAVALPLAPLAPGAAAAAGTFVAGSVAYVAQQIYGFRAPLPPLPRMGGKAGGPTLKELVADAIAGARVPVALPPSPLGPRGNWAAIGASALLGLLANTTAQLWGLFRPAPLVPIDPSSGIEGPVETTGEIRLYRYLNGSFVGTYIAGIRAVTGITTVLKQGFYRPYYEHTVSYTATNGTTGTGLGYTDAVVNDFPRFVNISGTVLDGGLQPVPLFDAASPAIVPLPQVAPPPPIPLPTTPSEPATQPNQEPGPSVVPATPGPTAPPATTPQVPRRTVPLPLPGAAPTKDGAVVPQAPAPVAVTPPDAHFPVPGAPPVTGNGPRPTPEGIAQELGRLEQKLARLSDPGPGGPGDGTDRLGLLFQILGQLVEFLTAIQSGGGYGLSSPCELDDNGNRIVTTVEYSGAPTTLGVVLNKIDALAALLQVHKDLKQPICKQTPAVGQPVTVDFLQVD